MPEYRLGEEWIAYQEAGDGPRTLFCIQGRIRMPAVWWSILETTPPGRRTLAIDYIVPPLKPPVRDILAALHSYSLPPYEPSNNCKLPALADYVSALLVAHGVQRVA